MGWSRYYVIATKEPLNKRLLSSCISEWVRSNLFNLKSISPKIALYFIDSNNFGGRDLKEFTTIGYIGNDPRLEFLNYLDALEWGISNENDYKNYKIEGDPTGRLQDSSFNDYLRYQGQYKNWLRENVICIYSTINYLADFFNKNYDEGWVINNEKKLAEIMQKDDAYFLERYRIVIEKRVLGKKYNHFYFGLFEHHNISANYEIDIENDKLLFISTKNI